MNVATFYVLVTVALSGPLGTPMVPGNKFLLAPPRQLGLALLPADLAYARVQVERLTSALERAVAKSGEESPLAIQFAGELKSARARVEKLEIVLARSNDPALVKEAERKSEAAMLRYREGLTMTKEQLAERSKREAEELERTRAEAKRKIEEELQLKLQKLKEPRKQ